MRIGVQNASAGKTRAKCEKEQVGSQKEISNNSFQGQPSFQRVLQKCWKHGEVLFVPQPELRPFRFQAQPSHEVVPGPTEQTTITEEQCTFFRFLQDTKVFRVAKLGQKPAGITFLHFFQPRIVLQTGRKCLENYPCSSNETS